MRGIAQGEGRIHALRVKTLLIEPFGGLAGDMFLAALLDLGEEAFGLSELTSLAEALVPGEARLALNTVTRASLTASHLAVTTPESAHPPHRHLAELEARIEGLTIEGFGAREKSRALTVLRRIAEAEGRVHGIAPERVHFHEVGAVDTLIDVCGATLALARLGVEQVWSSAPYVGGGTVVCAHGTMPVPAPGTAELLRDVPQRFGPGGERVTPTGAALLVGFVDRFLEEQAPTDFCARALGYGAGTREPHEGPPNLVRVQLGDAEAGLEPRGVPSRAHDVVLMEFQVDDATGEELGFLREALEGAGALDVWTSACQMKKGRPGVVVAFLARPQTKEALLEVAFAHSSTLGIRCTGVERRELPRHELEVELEGERVRVKVSERGGVRELSPEYEDLARVARSSGRSIRALAEQARELARSARSAPGRAGGSAASRSALDRRSSG